MLIIKKQVCFPTYQTQLNTNVICIAISKIFNSIKIKSIHVNYFFKNLNKSCLIIN